MRVCIGDRGQAVSDLRPTGEIVVQGQRLAARCEIGYVAAGTDVIVVAAEPFQLVVHPANETAPLPNEVGQPLPTSADRVRMREEREQRVWAEERRQVLLERIRELLTYMVVVGAPGMGLGWWLGGQEGLLVALAVVILVPVVLYSWLCM